MLTEIDRFNALIVGASQGIGLGVVKALLQQKNVERVFATYRNRKLVLNYLPCSNSTAIA